MKIMVLTDRYPPFSTGGYDIGCQEIVESLKERGHEVAVVTTAFGLPCARIDGGVRRVLGHCDPELVKRPATYAFAQFKRALMFRHNAAAVKRIVAEISPDMVYGFQLRDVGLMAIREVSRFGCPLVFDIQDYWLSEHRRKLSAERGIAGGLAALLNGISDFGELDLSRLYVISETLRKDYAAAGFPEEIAVIPRGIRRRDVPELTARQYRPDGPVRLLFAGRLTPEKGPDIAIKAWGVLTERIGARKVTLTLAGDGERSYLAYLHSAARRAARDGDIRFLGKLERSVMMREYREHDFLLFPSVWTEPFGVTVIEAMASGLPVIATGTGGPAEMINDGQNGFLTGPGDYRAIAAVVERLASDPAECARIRENAYRTVRENYDFDREMERISAYLTGVPAREGDRR